MIPDNGFVRVRGAREHNLKNVNVDLPRNAIVVFTGVSGSGKSSLAFGTLYAEAQRRYFESVAPYARRLIEQVGVPDVDSIEGLPPAIALQQQRGTPTTRSSVGSVTSLSNLLRMLYSRAGRYPRGQPMLYAEDFSPNTAEGACPQCHGLGRIYEATEASMVPDDSLTIRERAVAAWPLAWQGQNQRDIVTTLGHDVDVPWRDLPKKTRDWILFTDETPTVPVYAGFTMAEVKQALKRKLSPSYQGTFTSARRYVLHTFATTQSALIKARVAKYIVGAECPLCHGKRLKREALSVTFEGFDIGALSQLPLRALAEVLRPVAAKARGSDGRAPTLEGMSGATTRDAHDATTGVGAVGRGTNGHDTNGNDTNDNGNSKVDEHDGDTLDRATAKRAIAARVAAGGSAHKASPDVRRTSHLSVEKVLAAQQLARAVLDRVDTLLSLGLGYLAIDRSTPTLSPGELQRLRLATQLGSHLFGVVYVLDEPSAGLHPADGEALFAALERLKSAGNSLFVVEHDLDIVRRADWLVDVGPAAGELGGQVLYSGPPAGLAEIEASVTRRHLFPEAKTAHRAPREAQGWLRLDGIKRNNLSGVDAAFPLGCFTTVTGVSGSGKSSLVSQALLELVAERLGTEVPADNEDHDVLDDLAADASLASQNGGTLGGDADRIQRLVKVDQKPIGRTPRSNLATYTGLFDAVRKLFAATPEARKRRYDAGRFSFNVAKGRCPTCEGEGFVSVELLFLPSVYAPCPACHGARYNAETLEVRWQDRHIADVLGMTVDAASSFFASEPAVHRALQVLRDIGLGYLRLGQPATELSGGEAQRIKLATELQRQQRGATLYVLDEPTTGLHPADVDRLVAQLDALVDAGNTVVVVEHDMRVAAGSDWVIDMGPGAGDEGGQIVAAGLPTVVATAATSLTATHLASALER